MVQAAKIFAESELDAKAKSVFRLLEDDGLDHRNMVVLTGKLLGLLTDALSHTDE